MTKETTLSARAAELTLSVGASSPAAEDLLASVLRGGGRLREEYPLIFGEGAPGRVVCLRDGAGEVRSACALLARRWVTPDQEFTAGLIGSVATDPAWRGAGLANRALAAAEDALAGAGCLFALLWADDPAFYERRGYVPIGCERDHVLLPGRRASLPEPDGVRPARPADMARLHELHGAHPVRVERSCEEMSSLMAVPGMQVLVREREGRVEAYACFGRGGDLEGVLHEWAGSPLDLLALLAGLLCARPGTESQTIVFAPEHAREHARALARAGLPGQRGILGLARLLDLDAAARALRMRCEGDVVVQTSGKGLVLSGPAGPVSLSAGEVLGLLFPARGEDGARVDLEQGLGGHIAPGGVAPFAWGLDSI